MKIDELEKRLHAMPMATQRAIESAMFWHTIGMFGALPTCDNLTKTDVITIFEKALEAKIQEQEKQ